MAKGEVFLKIISICVSICVLIDTTVYAMPMQKSYLRPNLISDSLNAGSDLNRLKNALSEIADRLKRVKGISLTTENTREITKNLDSKNKTLGKISSPPIFIVNAGIMGISYCTDLFLTKKPLSAKQKEITGKVIDIFNDTYKLKIDSAAKKKIIDEQIFIVSRSNSLKAFIARAIYPLALLSATPSSFLLAASTIFLIETTIYKAISGPTYDAVRKEIFIPEYKHDEETEDFFFAFDISHELAHLLRLPNNELLANAYEYLTEFKLYPARWLRELKSIKKERDSYKTLSTDYESLTSFRCWVVADQMFDTIPDPIIREATIRKILSRPILHRKLKKCWNNKIELEKLITRVSEDLKDNDYKMPRMHTDNFMKNKWVHRYGESMAWLAMKTYPDIEDAFRYIYTLGQAHDSRELRKFQTKQLSLNLVVPANNRPDTALSLNRHEKIRIGL
jgi:hypothetical protein